MSFGDLTRIGTNVQAQQANNYLQRTNQQIGQRQLRLATGSQINRAEDDSAGYSISKKLEARVRGQAQALANVGDAKSMLTVSEGALNSVMDILQTMKEKTIQAANDTMGEQERTAIKNQLDALREEIGDVLEGTTFNGTKLFESENPFNFQVGAESGENFAVSIAQLDTDGLLGAVVEAEGTVTEGDWAGGEIEFVGYTGSEAQTFNFRIEDGDLEYRIDGDGDWTNLGTPGSVNVGGLTLNVDLSDVDDGDSFDVAVTPQGGGLIVNSHESASASIATVDAAINQVSEQLANIGDSQKRLSFKQDNLQTSMTNYEAARSRINDADFAKEQMELIKLQILQQTGTAALAQANAAPQAVLSLF